MTATDMQHRRTGVDDTRTIRPLYDDESISFIDGTLVSTCITGVDCTGVGVADDLPFVFCSSGGLKIFKMLTGV